MVFMDDFYGGIGGVGLFYYGVSQCNCQFIDGGSMYGIFKVEQFGDVVVFVFVLFGYQVVVIGIVVVDGVVEVGESWCGIFLKIFQFLFNDCLLCCVKVFQVFCYLGQLVVILVYFLVGGWMVEVL